MESFDMRGLHLIHLNINSLLDKIDQLRFIEENATLIGITESEVEETQFDIDGYTTIRNYITKHGGGGVYIKESLSSTRRETFTLKLKIFLQTYFYPKLNQH